MARPSCWTVLIFTFFFDVHFTQDAGDGKGLVVSTFPNWVFDGQLQVYHNDPSTFQTDNTVGVTKMDVGYYTQITSLISNTRDDAIILLDAATNTIYEYQNFNLYMNHTSQKYFKIHTGVSATTSQIAFDWLTRNVYWTDGFYKWIATHPLRFPNDTSVYKIIVRDHLTKPEGIAVDPFQRYLFWSDVIGDKSKIERSNLAGDSSTRKTIVLQSIPLWISSLSVDTETQTLYWSDINRQTIERCDYDGHSRGVVRRVLGASFLAISLSKDVVCGTEYSYLNVLCLDKVTGNTTWIESYLYQEPWATTVYDKDFQQLRPHSCENKNCEQICFNMDQNTAICSCKEGYKLTADGRTCESEHGFQFGQAVIIANRTDACMYDIHINTNAVAKPDCFLTNLTNLAYFVVDSHEKMFYYVDDRSSAIIKVDMISKSQKVIYTDTAASISGLALDWVEKNILWTDSDSGKITTHSLERSFTTDLVTLLNNPSSITVDPHNRKMYWFTGSGYESTLEEGNLDGTDLRIILRKSEISYPESLYFDVWTKRLFWINDADLVSMFPNGSDPTYHAYTGYATHLLIYQDYTLWTTVDGGLEMAHKDSYYSDIVLNVDYMGQIAAIGIYDAGMQPMETNNCTNSNGGCEHICEPTGTTTRRCICNFGFELEPDGTSCSSTPYTDSFALIPDVTHDQIYQVSLSDGQLKAIDVPQIEVPVSVIYDGPTKKMYWTNALRTEIRSSSLKSDTSEILYDTISTLPIGLAFDYSSGLLYFTTEYWWNPSYIGCIHPHVGKVLKLVTENLHLPKNIALYPSKGLMFWTDITTDTTTESSIGKAYMDGTNVQKIVSNNINSPNGIVIDYSTDRLYWADADLSRIESVNLDGNDRKVLVYEAGAQLVGLDISPPYLYYVGRNKQRISKYNLTTNKTVMFMSDVHALGRIESVRVYPEQVQPVNTHCMTKNGGCALFCLPTPSGRSCGCEDGDNLKDDGKTCNNHVSCTTAIPNAILEQRCIGHSTGQCNFTCASGYTKSVDILTCGQNGNWDHPIHTVCQSDSGTCLEAIAHGHIAADCDKKIGSVCSYTCSVGYVPAYPNDARITCTTSGAWSKPVDNLCIRSTKKCPNTISNGALDSNCPHFAGAECDFTCNTGFQKNPNVVKLVCLSSGEWNYNGEVCLEAMTGKCKTTILNGVFDSPCSFQAGRSCSYTCNSGHVKSPLVNEVECKNSGSWNFVVDSLCTKAMASCSKSEISHGSFINTCTALHGDTCGYICDNGYIQQPIVRHVVCQNGKWSVNPDSLCIEQSNTVIAPQKQTAEEGTSSGAVAGITIAAIVITVIVVLAIVYFVWWRKKPAGTYVSNNTNLKFKRFDDSNVTAEQGISGFSNPMTNQPDYGNFGHLREEGYVTADITPSYPAADPKDVNIGVTKASNGTHSNSDA